MQAQKFTNGTLSFDAFLLKDGSYVFHAASICVDCELSELSNSSRYVKDNVPGKWYLEISNGHRGRPALYLLEPGLYYLLMKTRNHTCFAFRDWVVEEVLPSIRQKGFYIDSEAILADQSKLELLESETASLRTRLEVAEQLNFQMRGYIDSQLDEVKKKSTATAKVEYQCYTDAADGNPIVYAAEMKKQRDAAIAEKQEIIDNAKLLASEVRKQLKQDIEREAKKSLPFEPVTLPTSYNRPFEQVPTAVKKSSKSTKKK